MHEKRIKTQTKCTFIAILCIINTTLDSNNSDYENKIQIPLLTSNIINHLYQ